MARSMKLVTGTCACCGMKQTMNITEYNEVQDEELTMMEYGDFKFVNINVCENCCYVNKDLSKLIGENTKKVVASEEYQVAYDEGYLDGYYDLVNEEYEDMYVGEYDALAMLYRAEGKYTIKYAKIQSRIADLKTVMRGAMYEDMCDNYDDEDEVQQYKDCIAELTKQINNANDECLKALKNVKLQYPYEVIFVAECLAKKEKFDKARDLIAGVRDNFTMDEELNYYIDEFLTEVEKI